MSYKKEYAPACERNSQVILEKLGTSLSGCTHVLEVGAGTGQHAVFFAAGLPHIQWTPSDRPGCLESILAWSAEAGLDNLSPPVELDLLGDPSDIPAVDAIVCVNTIHIVAWQGTERLFEIAAEKLPPSGVVHVYGPYRYLDRPLEPSNESFDDWLKARDPASGVRDFAAVNRLAQQAGLELMEDAAMPANNRSIWWRKRQI